MGQISMVFFEKFKDLEKICNEIYGKTGGVTEYINEMEKTSLYDSVKISGWEADLKELKRVRHIRNNMAHEGSFDSAECTEEDVAFLNSFHDRIFKAEDPLALKRKLKKTNPVVKKQAVISQARASVDNMVNIQSAVVPKETVIEKKEYEEHKKGKVKVFLFVLLAACLAVGVYFVIRSDLLNRLKYSKYTNYSDIEEYQKLINGSIDSIDLYCKFEKTVTITDTEKISEIVNLLNDMSFSFVASYDIYNSYWDTMDIIICRGNERFRTGFTFFKYDYMYLQTDRRLYCYKLDRERKELADIFPWFSNDAD